MLIKDILLVSVIAVVASVVMFSVNELTGKAVYQSGALLEGIIQSVNYELTSIEINPNVVKLGESVEIIVKPGDYGVYKKIYIYEKDVGGFDNRIDIVTLDCIGFKCTKKNGIVKELYRPENYFGKGEFYVKAKDGSKEWVKAEFRII